MYKVMASVNDNSSTHTLSFTPNLSNQDSEQDAPSDGEDVPV
jgi:hypothetical protein